MSLEQHTVSLELAKKMKDLGFPQTSEFSWYELSHYLGASPKVQLMHPLEAERLELQDWHVEKLYSAPLASELGVWLPTWVYVCKTDEDYYCWGSAEAGGDYRDAPIKDLEDDIQPIHAETIPNAMAKMLIYLAENGYIDPKLLSSENKDEQTN